MQRRMFLKASASAIPAAFFALEADLRPATARPAEQLTLITSGVAQVAALVGNLNLLASGISQLASSAQEFWSQLTGRPREVVQNVHERARQQNYSSESSSAVFRSVRAASNFYGLGHVDFLNAIVPFYSDGDLAAVVEGPAVVGLALAARD